MPTTIKRDAKTLTHIAYKGKHVEVYSKNKFEKLVHLVGFIIRKYTDISEMDMIQASAAMCMRSVLFWYLTQRRVVIPHRRLSTAYRS